VRGRLRGQRGQHRVERHRLIEGPARGGEHGVTGGSAPVGEGAQQRRLADAGLPVDDQGLRRAAAGSRRGRFEAGELGVPADRAGGGGRGRRGNLILGAGRRGALPQGLDEHAGRHGPPGGQREQVQRQPRLPAAERLLLDAVDAEIAEHPHGQRLHAGNYARG
jgi:hypothetical protein